MIQYRDWYIWTQGQVVARQFDHMTRSLEVVGELPEGWEWTAIVRVGDYMDYLPLTLTQTGAAITLTAQQLSLAGMYSIQLRGKQGELVRHTNVLSVYVPASLSGDKQWPTIPSEFTEMEHRITEKAAQVEGYATHCPIIGENGNWWVWSGGAYADSGKPSQGDKTEIINLMLAELAFIGATVSDDVLHLRGRTGTRINAKADNGTLYINYQ